MPLSLKEITQREKALRQEIREREHLLRAYESMRADLAEPAAEDATEPPAEPPDAATSAPQPSPELTALPRGDHKSSRFVVWAINQMTDDFDLHDLADLLARCDCTLKNPQISVVLSRLNNQGRLELIRPGSGRSGAVFRRRAGVRL